MENQQEQVTEKFVEWMIQIKNFRQVQLYSFRLLV